MGKSTTQRPPIISVMGHIDHGKSTLLDTIRKANTAESEPGGITQHTSAYEITHSGEDGEKRMTFLDTPGHEAFIDMRKRGATVADIAILVVAADDGVEEQTKETIEAIKSNDTPYIVAINKTDKDGADPQAVVQSLAEHEVYVEGFGGDVPYEKISAKTGDGIDELLDLVTVQSELLELTTNNDENASGIVIESSVDSQRGTQATLVIKNGTLKKGMHVHADGCVSPVRISEDFRGKSIETAQASSPVQVVGFDEEPTIGSSFDSFTDKSEARAAAKAFSKSSDSQQRTRQSSDAFTIPVLVKADVAGTIDAVIHEIDKLQSDQAELDIVQTGVGDITEDDIRSVASEEKSGLAVGFNVKATRSAHTVAGRRNVAVKTAPIIYDLIEWLESAVAERTPTITVKSVLGKARILKNFSSKQKMQVVGGEVVSGTLQNSSGITIYRNENELAEGEIIELQQQRAETDKVKSGQEFGANIRSQVDIAPGDIIESFEMVEK
jgi:translation initiation factor IF-2